jgi:hypothetical protein
MASDGLCLPPQVRELVELARMQALTTALPSSSSSSSQVRQLVDYTQSVLEAKVAAYDKRQQSADLAIISNLDRDGNGFIDLSEFLGLSKYTSISEVCAARQGRDRSLRRGLCDRSPLIDRL